MDQSTDLKAITEMLEEQGRLFKEYRDANEAALKAKAEGKAVGDIEAKLAKLDTRMLEISEIKQAVDTLLAAQNRSALGGLDRDADIQTECKSFNLQRRAAAARGAIVDDLPTEVYKHYKSAFMAWARTGNIDSLSSDERKAMSAGTSPDGGYLLPAATVARSVARIWEMSPIRQIANVQAISGDSVEGLIDNDEAAASWVGETTTRSDTATPQVGQYKIEPYEMYCQPPVTQKLLDDAAFDVEGWLAGKVADKFARAEAAAFCTGTGVAKPRGFAGYTTAATADASRTWGTFEHVKTGANGAFANTSPADCLFDLIGAFKAGYLANARWVSRREAITALRKLKEATTNAYMWQPGLQVGQPDRLLGYPLVIAQDMPAISTGTNSMALGDFREAYTIVDRIGIRTLRDPYTSKPYVRFYSSRRVGGGAVNFEAIKFINFAA